MGKTLVETAVGAVVLLFAAYFMIVLYTGGKTADMGGYELNAKFDRVDGLRVGSDVRLSGLSVGAVTKLEIEPESYLAVAYFSVLDEVKVPEDSTAEIVSDGLLGGKYLSLVPGGGEHYLKAGDRVKFTQSSVNLESLIGKFMFGGAEDKDNAKASEGQPAAGDGADAVKSKNPDDIF